MSAILNLAYRRVLRLFLEELGDIDTCYGICNTSEKALSDDHQTTISIFRKHFKENKPTPTLHPEFYYHHSYVGCYYGEVFWWSTEIDLDVISEQRIKFLAKMIQITDPKNTRATSIQIRHFLKN